jgi:hypothetical protein
MTTCNVCGAPAKEHAQARILGKYDIRYDRCTSCGFIQTESPYWLEESYSSAIKGSDVGLIKRNQELAPATARVIHTFFDVKAKFIDYGGGYGMLVRMMRDLGYDFYWQDKYAQNLMALGFEVQVGSRYELLTAFEVFEHLPNPNAELKLMLEWSDSVFFSTVLQPKTPPMPENWWYYGLNHGQHVALYTRESLNKLASANGLNFYTNGKNLHLFTKKRISNLAFAVLCSRIGFNFNPLSKRKSLQHSDFERLTSI